MRLLRTIVVMLVLSLPVAAGATPPLDAYGALPALENVTISPDGNLLAYVTNGPGRRMIQVLSIDGHKVINAIQAGPDKLRELRWADNDTLLITVSNARYMGWYGERELSGTVAYNILTGTIVNLLKKARLAGHLEAGPPESRVIGGKTQIFVPGATLSGLAGVLTMFRVDPDSGDVTEIEDGTKNTEAFLLDDSGNVVARTDYDEDKQRWSLLMRKGAAWTEVYGVNSGIETPILLGLGPEGKTAIVSTTEGGRAVFRQFNLVDGSAAAPLNVEGTEPSLIYDPIGHRPIGALNVDDHFHFTFFKASDQSAWNSVVHAFPGEDVQFVSWSADRKRIVALVTGKRDGASYEIIDLNTGHADLLSDAYAGIEPADVAEVRPISYAAADGLKIPAFLTLPNGKPAKNLPLIVLPHGGPAARDMPGFDWWAQAIASRGYAVLQPQFRGSDGYGWAFLAAGFGEWGHKMQTDLSDGARFLAEQGIVDPKRVCIIGASYGGYAALAGAALQRGIYRCAASVAGISDPMNMMSHLPGHGRGERYLERFFGVSGFSDRKLDEVAPLAHSSDVDIPVLLVHGTNDSVVSSVQSQFMHDAMVRDGKAVTMILLNSEDHWLSVGATRQLMLSKTVDFLEKNNPPN